MERVWRSLADPLNPIRAPQILCFLSQNPLHNHSPPQSKLSQWSVPLAGSRVRARTDEHHQSAKPESCAVKTTEADCSYPNCACEKPPVNKANCGSSSCSCGEAYVHVCSCEFILLTGLDTAARARLESASEYQGRARSARRTERLFSGAKRFPHTMYGCSLG